MLIETSALYELFRCPTSGESLTRVGNKLLAGDGGTNQEEYEIIDELPILINFGNSILNKEDVKSVRSLVKRHSYSGLPGLVRRVLSPVKPATTNSVKSILEILGENELRPKVLIIGGGKIGNGMEVFHNEPDIDFVSFDIYGSPNVQFVADAHDIPLLDGSFDLVIIQAVLEHVLEPARVVEEIHRVLKPSGLVYAETPFLQHVHEGAYDFTRFTESGHRFLFKNFELIKSGVIAGAGTQLLWSIDYFFRGMLRSRIAGKIAKVCFFWLQYFDEMIPDSYNSDAASALLFLGKKSGSAIGGKEVIRYYKGAQ